MKGLMVPLLVCWATGIVVAQPVSAQSSDRFSPANLRPPQPDDSGPDAAALAMPDTLLSTTTRQDFGGLGAGSSAASNSRLEWLNRVDRFELALDRDQLSALRQGNGLRTDFVLRDQTTGEFLATRIIDAVTVRDARLRGDALPVIEIDGRPTVDREGRNVLVLRLDSQRIRDLETSQLMYRIQEEERGRYDVVALVVVEDERGSIDAQVGNSVPSYPSTTAPPYFEGPPLPSRAYDDRFATNSDPSRSAIDPLREATERLNRQNAGGSQFGTPPDRSSAFPEEVLPRSQDSLQRVSPDSRLAGSGQTNWRTPPRDRVVSANDGAYTPPGTRFGDQKSDFNNTVTRPPLGSAVNGQLDDYQRREAALDLREQQLQMTVRDMQNQQDRMKQLQDQLDAQLAADRAKANRRVSSDLITPVGHEEPAGPEARLADQRNGNLETGNSTAGGRRDGSTNGDAKVNMPPTEEHDRQDWATFFLLLISLGGNAYMALLCRSFYVRYGELADELRETFTSSV